MAMHENPDAAYIFPPPGTYNESAGSEIQISASQSLPSQGGCDSYTFDQWSGSGNGNYTGRSLTGNVIMNSNILEYADFSCT
jgi:hypothetical protein